MFEGKEEDFLLIKQLMNSERKRKRRWQRKKNHWMTHQNTRNKTIFYLQDTEVAITFHITSGWTQRCLSICIHTAENNRQAVISTLTDDYFIWTVPSLTASHLQKLQLRNDMHHHSYWEMNHAAWGHRVTECECALLYFYMHSVSPYITLSVSMIVWWPRSNI